MDLSCPKNYMARTWSENYHELGKRRCDKSFGTFPVLRISSYGKFFTMTILHKPIRPVSSGTCPSVDSFANVCSSTNITKQTFFLEYSLICSKCKHFSVTSCLTRRGLINNSNFISQTRYPMKLKFF